MDTVEVVDSHRVSTSSYHRFKGGSVSAISHVTDRLCSSTARVGKGCSYEEARCVRAKCLSQSDDEEAGLLAIHHV